MNTSIGGLAEEIQRELTIYSQSVTEAIKKEAKESIQELVKQTRSTAPVGKRKKHYKSNITSRKIAENSRMVSYIWYVKEPDYRLSHLLENGHALRNGGRTQGTHFIRNASEPILERYIEKVEEAIRNG